MSIVEHFSKSGANFGDPIYPLVKEVSALRKQILEGRQRIMMECVSVSDIGRGNDAKLTIADRALFEQLNGEVKDKEARLGKILEAFIKLDEIISQVQAKGLRLRDGPTPYGVMKCRIDSENRIITATIYMRDSAAKAIAQGTSISDVSTESDPKLQEDVKFLKDIEAKCNAILSEL